MKIKKIIASLLVFAMIAGMLPQSAMAFAGEVQTTVTDEMFSEFKLTDTNFTYNESTNTQNKVSATAYMTVHDDVTVINDEVEAEIERIVWESNDETVFVCTNEIIPLVTTGTNSKEWKVFIGIQCLKSGEATLTGTLPSGLTASCKITVNGEGDTEKSENPGTEEPENPETEEPKNPGTEKPEDSDAVTEITLTKEVEDTSYGMTTYKKTKEGKIQEQAERLEKSMDYYIQSISEQAESDYDAIEGGENSAQKLREADEATNDKIITMPYGTSEKVMNSVYETFAMYLNEYVDKGIDLGKIDLSKNIIEIEAGLINKISNSLDTLDYSQKVGQYTVRFNVTRMWDAYTGSITVIGKGGPYYGAINSTSAKTASIMNEYVNELSDLAKDLEKKALLSIVADIGSVTGISEFTKIEWKSFLNSHTEFLYNNSYGDVLSTIQLLRDDYDAIKTLLDKVKKGDLQESFEQVENVYEQLKNSGDYTDETVQKEFVSDAMSQSTKIKNELIDTLYEYVYDTDDDGKSLFDTWKEQHSDWWIFKIQCPVAVTVYDGNGTQIGYAGNNKEEYSEDLYMEVNGDVKNIYVPKDVQGTLEFTPTADGTMNYIIEEVTDVNTTGRLNYYDVPLEVGIVYTQDIPAESMSGSIGDYPLVSDNGESIIANEYINSSKEAYVTITSTADEGGMVHGETVYAKGDSVSLTAFVTDDAYRFTGWYVNDNLVGIGNTYCFTAMEDTSVHAEFKKKDTRVVDTVYTVTYGVKYEEFACAQLYG